MTIPPELYPIVDRWIAEHVMGWTRTIIGEDGFKFGVEKWFDEEEQETKYEYLDGFGRNYWNPCTDLNDVKLCVDKLEYRKQLYFTKLLESSTYNPWCLALENLEIENRFHMLNATAEQRVIALLLTLNEGKSLEEILTMIKEEYEYD